MLNKDQDQDHVKRGHLITMFLSVVQHGPCGHLGRKILYSARVLTREKISVSSNKAKFQNSEFFFKYTAIMHTFSSGDQSKDVPEGGRRGAPRAAGPRGPP